MNKKVIGIVAVVAAIAVAAGGAILLGGKGNQKPVDATAVETTIAETTAVEATKKATNKDNEIKEHMLPAEAQKIFNANKSSDASINYDDEYIYYTVVKEVKNANSPDEYSIHDIVRESFATGEKEIVVSNENVNSLFVDGDYVYFSSYLGGKVSRVKIGTNKVEELIKDYYRPVFAIAGGKLIVCGYTQDGASELKILNKDGSDCKGTGVHCSSFVVYNNKIYTMGTAEQFDREYRLAQVDIKTLKLTWLDTDFGQDKQGAYIYYEVVGVDENNIYLNADGQVGKYSFKEGAISTLCETKPTATTEFVYGDSFVLYRVDNKIILLQNGVSTCIAENVHYNIALINNHLYVQRTLEGDWEDVYAFTFK